MTAAVRRKATLRTRAAPVERQRKSHQIKLRLADRQQETDVVKPEKATAPIPLERLREAAARERARPIPHQARLATAFGTEAQSVEAVWSPEISAALDLTGAEAATVDGRVALKGPNVAFHTVAHETAHVLQARNSEAHTLVPAAAPAEAEAEAAAQVAVAGSQVGKLRQALPASAVALRRPAESVEQADADRAARQNFSDAASETTVEQEPQAETTAAGTNSVAAGDVGDSTTSDSSFGAGMEPAPTFELPPDPVIEVDEEAAARATEAQAEITGATTADGYLEALTTAPPSIKAQFEPTVEDDMARLAADEEGDFQESVPDFEAQMGGGEDIPPPAAVEPPGGATAPLEADAPAPLDPADEGRLPAPAPYQENGRVVDLLMRIFGLGDSGSIGRSLSAVKTSDDVETDPGPPPPVPLEGEADPQRIEDQGEAANEQARSQRHEATAAVMDGRGPEEVQARPLQETMALPELAQAEFEGTTEVAEGAAEFREKTLDPEVVALFDAEHGPVMESSLSTARSDLDAATERRDTDRQNRIQEAETENARLNEEADNSQRGQIIESRNQIQTARQTAVDGQAQAVTNLQAEAETERRLAEGTIETHVSAENQRISDRYDTAETDAEAEVQAGERRAEAEKADSEREAENSSWWDRAVNWVADQFDKLTAAINRVFDAVRSAIKDFVDAAKQFAEEVIDATANFVKDAIRGFGEILKAAVDTLLADTFPELAQALNDGIDSAVETAVEAVDAIAEGLKAGINALLDVLGAALDAILAAYQAVINGVLALARAAITGDWSAVARMILEPILKALGIDPEEFYAYFGHVAEVIGQIIDEPGAFIRNLLDGVMGGFSRFGENLLRHLQAGIIGWLTGTLGGDITIPERWDLMGVLDLIRQILGLTVALIRRVAVRILGEAAVEKIEFFIEFAVELITGGWQRFFDKIRESLSNLQNMVLEQIKGFLVERIIIAAVTWLIGLFNPLGALVKIVMTIWNLIMFLKNQMMRIIEVVRTVVQLIMDIAMGILEPVIAGVEGVLARMVPIVIDLLARLLGLGNVAGRVREIIGNVREVIEDAIVGLIRRVIARFTGGRRGDTAGADGDDPAGAGAAGQIMAPITVRGGGETHTLFIKTAANDATPMMRSEEQTVEGWLNSLKTQTTVATILKRKDAQAPDENIAEVHEALQPLVRKALGEETQLENEADSAARAPAATTSSAGGRAAVTTGPDPAATREGQQLAAVMRQILEKLGLVDESGLAGKFETDIGKMRPAVGENFSRFILPKMENSSNAYGHMDWVGVRQTLPGDSSSLTNPWQRPASNDGMLRNRTNGAFGRAAADKARDVANNLAEKGVPGAEDFDIAGTEQEKIFNNILAGYLNENSNAMKLIDRLLGPKQISWTVILGDVDKAFEDAVKSKLGKKPSSHPDFEIRKQITGTSYKTLYKSPGQLATKTYTYYKEQTADGEKKDGSSMEEHTLDWFLNPRAPHSDRHGENRTRVANAVRAASPGQHEWILSSTAFAAINATIAAVRDRGASEGLEGIANFLEFQHEVRTSTSDLIFDPKWAGATSTVGFFSPKHHERIVGNSPADLTAEYQGLPAIGSPVKTLQAHAGGLSALQPEGAALRRFPLQQASPRWHTELKQAISSEMADDGYLELKSIRDLGDSIVGYFKKTVLGSSQTSGNVSLLGSGQQAFNLYYITHGSDGKPKSLNEMKSIAETAYERADKELEAKINKVVGG